MATPHEGIVNLKNSFDKACNFLKQVGKIKAITPKGTAFFAEVGQAIKGERSGQMVIKFYQKDLEFGRSYRCCWGKYYNCNRTRIGMYCKALDNAIGNDIPETKHKAKNYFSEKDMEDAIATNPGKYIGESGLSLIARQYSIGPYRFDLLFEDRHGSKLVVELQKGTLDRSHTYKILDYYDEYKLKKPTEFLELMVIANVIPRERRQRLSSMGISFIEIPASEFINYRLEFSDVLNTEGITIKSADEASEKVDNVSMTSSENKAYFSFELDEAKYNLDDIIKKTSPDIQNICYYLNDKMKIFSKELYAKGYYKIYAKTHKYGISYFCTEKKSFLFLNIRHKFISLIFYTGGNKIEGVIPCNWITGTDRNGGKMTLNKIEDVDAAISAAKVAYFLAFNESGTPH